MKNVDGFGTLALRAGTAAAVFCFGGSAFADFTLDRYLRGIVLTCPRRATEPFRYDLKPVKGE